MIIIDKKDKKDKKDKYNKKDKKELKALSLKYAFLCFLSFKHILESTSSKDTLEPDREGGSFIQMKQANLVFGPTISPNQNN